MRQDKYFWDISRQKYIAFYRDTQELQVVEKEQIKRDIFTQAPDQWKNIKDTLFLDGNIIPSRYFTFTPFKPEEWNENGHTYRNTYMQTEIQKAVQNKRKNSDISLLSIDFEFIKKYPHIEALIDNLLPIKEQKEYLLNWLSYIFATNKKTRVAVLLRGIQGTGKGVLWEQIIQHFYGKNFTLTVDNDTLNSKFTPNGMERVMFVQYNEIKGDFRDGNTAYEKLKMHITDSTIKIEEKGVNAFELMNNFNCIFSSNHKTPLQIQGGDRRYSIFSTRSRKLKDVANEDFKETEEQFIDGIQNERDGFLTDLVLYNYDSILATTCMETEEKEAIYRASMTKIEILADKVKKLDEKYLLNELIEIIEDTEDAEDMLEKAKITLIYNEKNTLDIERTAKSIFDEMKMSLIENAYIRTSILVAYYRFFVEKGADMAKIGKHLTEHFGLSNENGKINGQRARVREIKEFKDKNFVKKIIPF